MDHDLYSVIGHYYSLRINDIKNELLSVLKLAIVDQHSTSLVMSIKQ